MKMRYLFLLLVLFPIIANTQVGKRIKFRTGTERCMSAGIPVADCFILSNGQGEFEPKTLADIKTKLGIPDQDFLESGGTPPNSDADEMYHTGDTHIGDATMSGTGKLNVVGVLSARQSIANNNLFISGGNLTATGSNNVGILSGSTLTTGTHNVFIKGGAASTTGSDNICIGNTAGGIAATDIDRTVCIGTSTGLGGSPDSSVLIGYEAGRSSVGGVYRNNVCIGYNANKVTSGSGGTGNVIIGSNAGKNMTVSNRLLIDNSSTSTPLIDGNFTTDEVKINGSLWVTDEIRDSSGDVGVNGEVLTSTGTGTNWVASDESGAVMRMKFTLTHTDFDTAATSNNIPLVTLPVNSIIHSIVINASTLFSGGGISLYNMTINSTTNVFITNNLFSAASQAVVAHNSSNGNSLSGVSLRAHVSSFGANLDQATQGIVDIWIYYSVLD